MTAFDAFVRSAPLALVGSVSARVHELSRVDEVLRRSEATDDGGSRVVAEEYAVMDRAGRVQLPREHREALALTQRVRLALEADHVAVRPADAPR